MPAVLEKYISGDSVLPKKEAREFDFDAQMFLSLLTLYSAIDRASEEAFPSFRQDQLNQESLKTPMI